MNKSNESKNKILGEPYGTANSKLKKAILFHLVIETNKDICFQCGEKIESLEEFSIEHKNPWMNAENPIESFYDINNIAFSHLKCNVRAANKNAPRPKARGENGYGNKLTWKEVDEIREKLLNGQKVLDLAKEYKVNKGTISSIKNNKSWIK